MKKLLKTGLTSVVMAGTLFAGFPASSATISNNVLQKSPTTASHSYGSLDLAVVNEEKLLESLIKRGVIPKDASTAEQQKALHNYLVVKGKQEKLTEADPLAAKAKAGDAKKRKKFKEYNNGFLKGQGNKYGQIKSVEEGTSPGIQKKGKLLTLTVEYSDLEHNKLKPEETDNYYTDYNLKHYEDMIFGEKGQYKGPNGEDQISQKQFYEEQSGGTYTVEGKAYGWLKVPGTAKFYGADSKTGHDNVKPGGSKQLVKDVYAAAIAAGIPLKDYDLEDPHDFDNDGNYWEADGFVDHLQIIHAGMGQEAGGGAQGDDAIWSHRSAVQVNGNGGLPGFYDYTMMPEDGATGVFAHEYGHDLGLPDEYDTQYTGTGEAIGYWSIMASGSWAGKIPGAEPTGFSPFAKSYFQSTLGGKWTAPAVINFKDVTDKGTQVFLDQANSPLGKNNQAVRVNLPQKKKFVLAPKDGKFSFWGGNGDEINNTMTTSVDLTGKTSATLDFDAWYKIEESWDFAFVQVSEDSGKTWKSLSNGNTRSDVVNGVYPTIPGNLPGFTGDSNGWQHQTFDLSTYVGKKIQIQFRYITDWGYSDTGLFVDNVKVTGNDGATILEDGAEAATPSFTFKGFKQFDGNTYSDHYYLLEWRNQKGVDEGLAHIARGNSLMSYDGGLVVWYVDDSFTDNWTGDHPGDGFLGVVDSHLDNDLQWLLINGNTAEASTRYHIADAAFGLDPTSGLNLDYPGIQTLTAPSQPGVPVFDDTNSFANKFMPDAGRNLPNYGLKVRVNAEAKDKSVGSIVIYK